MPNTKWNKEETQKGNENSGSQYGKQTGKNSDNQGNRSNSGHQGNSSKGSSNR